MKNLIAITGNTYPVKDQIRALGGKWDAQSKVWLVSQDVAAQAQALVVNTKDSKKTTFVHHKCKDCGCLPSRYNPIYRSGVCKNCYVSEKEEREMGY